MTSAALDDAPPGVGDGIATATDDGGRPRAWLPWALALCLLVTVANIVTGSRSPTVWIDEVMFCDPAINYLTGRGFTSTAWPVQSREETFAGNAPLYPLMLIPWLKVFGVGPLA